MAGEYGEPIFWYRDKSLTEAVLGGGFPVQDSRGTVIAVCAGETIAQRMQDTYNALDGIPDSELAEFVKRAKEDNVKFAALAWFLLRVDPVEIAGVSGFLGVERRDGCPDPYKFIENIVSAYQKMKVHELGLEVKDE